MARKFFFVCMGLLCLSIAYHLGTTSAMAQANSSVSGLAVVEVPNTGGILNLYALTPNGDVFLSTLSPINGYRVGPAAPAGNIWSAPTPAQQSTFGSVKVRYR